VSGAPNLEKVAEEVLRDILHYKILVIMPNNDRKRILSCVFECQPW
jgi:hypothetical protein